MKELSARRLLLPLAAVLCCHTMGSYSEDCEETADPKFRVRAVNMGGWLVTEGWIKPTLFDAIPNKDLLDGTGLQLKSRTTGKYLCAEGGGGSILVANRTSASAWETFNLWRIDESTFNFRVFSKQFVGLGLTPAAPVLAAAKTPGKAETFQILRNSRNSSLVRIKASNGRFLEAKSEVLVTADPAGGGGETWDVHDPSVFELTVAHKLQGEYQLTNGYGPEKAPGVLREHWRTFISEQDFKLLGESGVNAVRIPVGWWIAADPHPPRPFVAGSLAVLDTAFSWAANHKLRVIIDLHAAPGSQNGWQHSASRDGVVEWGLTDRTINQTVEVIDFLTARYVSRSLLAVELMNEPRSEGVSLDSLSKYYLAAYRAVRRHSAAVYVVMANRVGEKMQPRELLRLAGRLCRTVVDVHFYNLFSDRFGAMTAQQNIDFVRTNRSDQLRALTVPNGRPLTFVGEWVAEWGVKGPGATKDEYRRFAAAQIEVYGRATFGWAYWTLKNVNHHWSWEWMINSTYIDHPVD